MDIEKGKTVVWPGKCRMLSVKSRKTEIVAAINSDSEHRDDDARV